MSAFSSNTARLPYRKVLRRAQSFLRRMREAYKEGQRLQRERSHQYPYIGF